MKRMSKPPTEKRDNGANPEREGINPIRN